MELASLDGLTLGSILAGLITALLIWITGIAVKRLVQARVVNRFLFLILNRFVWRITIMVAVSVLGSIAVAMASFKAFGVKLDGPLSAAVAFSLLLTINYWKFSRVGLHNAQLSVASGTDYRKALDLCRNSFSFLGTGAFKLTSEPGFEDAVLRCNDDSQSRVRLLLSNPENPLIAEAERKAGVAPGTFKLNVIKSLKTLQRLKEDRNGRFEVRFYKSETDRDFENFRMMFIDEEVLLLSYNVYGKPDAGAGTAQLVLLKSRMMPSADSFYIAYQGYFDRLWIFSDPWDFQSYV